MTENRPSQEPLGGLATTNAWVSDAQATTAQRFTGVIGDAGTNPLRFEVDERLKRFKEFPSKTTYDLLVNNVTAARNGGVDVSDVEPRLPELEKLIKI